MRYIPFFIITFVLYTLFFYNNQQPEILAANKVSDESIINEKIIPLDFEEIAKKDQQQQLLTHMTLVTKRQETPTLTSDPTPTLNPSPSPEVKIVFATIEVKKAVLSEPVPSRINITAEQLTKNSQQLHVLIKSTPASESALLKGELYERGFYLHLPPPPAQKNTKQKNKTMAVVAETSVSNQLLKQTKNMPVNQQKNTATNTQKAKPKRSFKKQAQAMKTNAAQDLPEAIAISGNKPHYPQKAKVKKQQGIVTVKFTVNMQGKTKNAQIISSSGHSTLDNVMLEFIKKERFMPALKGIEKVTSEQQFSYTFLLK